MVALLLLGAGAVSFLIVRSLPRSPAPPEPAEPPGQPEPPAPRQVAPRPAPAPRARWTHEELRAIEIAWEQASRYAEVEDRWWVTVEREGDEFVVTWPGAPDAETRSETWHARARIDAQRWIVLTLEIRR